MVVVWGHVGVNEAGTRPCVAPSCIEVSSSVNFANVTGLLTPS
jgi:hypothetical protein